MGVSVSGLMRLRNRVLALLGVEDPMFRDVWSGVALAFLLRVSGSALGLAVNVLLARLLGASGAGVYYLALTVSTVSTVVGRMGMDSALLKYAAAGAAERDWTSLSGVYRKGIGFSAANSAVAALIVVLGAPLISTVVFHEPELTTPLRIMAPSIPLVSLVLLHGELLKGLGRVRDAMIVSSVGIPAAHIPLLILLARSYGPAGAAAGYLGSATAVLILGRHAWRRATPFLRGVQGQFSTEELLSTSLPLFWVASLYLVMGWTDTVMLGVWSDIKEVGLYNVAFRTAVMTKFILVAVNSVVAPRFAALHQTGDYSLLENLAQRSTRGIALTAAPIMLVLVALPSFVLSLFGAEFEAGARVLQVLAAGQFVVAATGSVGYLLSMTGNERALRNISVVAAVVNVTGNAALIPPFGMMGAAVATSTSTVLQNLGAYYLVRRKLGLNVW